MVNDYTQLLCIIPEECVETVTDFIRVDILLGREQMKDMDREIKLFIRNPDRSKERKIQMKITKRVHTYMETKHKDSKLYSEWKNRLK